MSSCSSKHVLKQNAFELRKKGKSYKEINLLLSVSKSTLSIADSNQNYFFP